jgi:hypothetical protein
VSRTFLKCFKKGDKAKDYSKILATGRRSTSVPGTTVYIWTMPLPRKNEVPESTHRSFSVMAKGQPAVIEEFGVEDLKD